MEGLSLTVERKEFNLDLDLVGKPIFYAGRGVLGNEAVSLEEYLLVTAIDKTTIEVVDFRKRTITLDITQVKAAAKFAVLQQDVVAPDTEEDVVAPGIEEEQQP